MFYPGKIVGPKWNWMAHSSGCWANAFCCEDMFYESLFDIERLKTDQNYKEEMASSRLKLLPSFPLWWPADNSDTMKEHQLMCRQYIDPTIQQLPLLYSSMKTAVHIPKFDATVDSKNKIQSNSAIRS